MTGTIAAVVFLTLVVSLVLTVPIGFSLGIASLGYILYTGQLTPGFIAQNMVTGKLKYVLVIIKEVRFLMLLNGIFFPDTGPRALI
jgi:C4-dicarboxylate transporter DctM subunit